MSHKYSHKFLDNAKQPEKDAFKTASKGEVQKAAEATDDFIRIKIADRHKKGLKNSQQIISETVAERYTSP